MFFRPRSIHQLTLLGFAAVALPLAAAVFVSVTNLRSLADESRQVVYQTSAVSRAGRDFIERLTAMERSARQYLVLKDETLVQGYKTHKDAFVGSVNLLRIPAEEAGLDKQLETIVSQEQSLSDQLQLAEPPAEFVESFPSLVADARALSYQVDQWLDAKASTMREAAIDNQRFVFWLSLISGVVTLVLAFVFYRIITQPLNRISEAITAIGDGRLNVAKNIHGPRDIQTLGTRIEWLDQRLDELEKQREAFLRNVSHELKTPLTALLEGIHLLEDEVAGQMNVQQKEITDILGKNSVKLKKLIEDLLRFNTMTVSEQAAEKMPCRVDTVTQTVLDSHAVVAASRNVTVKRQLLPAQILAHPEQLRVMVDNLMSNALRYTPVGGEIKVVVRTQKDKAIIDIFDNGPGVAKEEAGKIFELFYTGGHEGDAMVESSGLGLAIVREYARLNQGTVELIESAKGACFRLIFPMMQNASKVFA